MCNQWIDQVEQEHFLKIGRNFQRMKALIEILLLSSSWGARNCLRADSQLGHASNDFWTEHEHIGPGFPGSFGTRLENISEFTMKSIKSKMMRAYKN